MQCLKYKRILRIWSIYIIHIIKFMIYAKSYLIYIYIACTYKGIGIKEPVPCSMRIWPSFKNIKVFYTIWTILVLKVSINASEKEPKLVQKQKHNRFFCVAIFSRNI